MPLYDLYKNYHAVGHELKFGSADAVTVIGECWDGYGDNAAYNYLTVATALKVSSSSTDDDGAPVGTGGRTVVIDGLTTGFVPATETVTLDGTTLVTTTTLFLRINRAYVLSAGSGGVNAGDIYIHNSAVTVGVPDDMTKLYAKIPADSGQTHMAVYTVPADHSLRFVDISCFCGSNTNAAKAGAVKIYTRDNALTDPSWRTRISVPTYTNSFALKAVRWLMLGEKTDVRASVSSNAATDMAVTMDISLFKNP